MQAFKVVEVLLGVINFMDTTKYEDNPYDKADEGVLGHKIEDGSLKKEPLEQAGH